jgi:proteic killer suppression protein
MEVKESKTFQKQIAKAAIGPKAKYYSWLESIATYGYEAVKTQVKWHDHPLHGDREGQRAIKIGGKWRAIYLFKKTEIIFIEMQEITPHDY